MKELFYDSQGVIYMHYNSSEGRFFPDGKYFLSDINWNLSLDILLEVAGYYFRNWQYKFYKRYLLVDKPKTSATSPEVLQKLAVERAVFKKRQ